MDEPDEIIMYVVVPISLNLPGGKLAIQVGHAVQLSMDNIVGRHDRLYQIDQDNYYDWYQAWRPRPHAKVLLKVDNHAHLEKLAKKLTDGSVPFVTVMDEGRTIVKPGTVTALGLPPMPRSVAEPFVKRLRLYPE